MTINNKVGIPLYTRIILKELKYATHTCSTVTYVFEDLIKSILEMSSRLLVACDEMRKRHFIDKINIKTSKTTKKANCDVNVWMKVKMPNIAQYLRFSKTIRCSFVFILP